MPAGVDDHRGPVDERGQTDTVDTEERASDIEPAGRIGGLWIDRFAEFTGVDTLLLVLGVQDRQTRDRYGPYVFIALLWAVVALGFPAIRFLNTGSYPLFETPGILILLPAWLFILAVIRGLQRRYTDVVTDDDYPSPASVGETDFSRYERVLTALGVPLEDDPPAFEPLVSPRLKAALLVPGLGFHATWFLVDPSPMSWLTSVWGPTLASVFFLLIVPFIFYVIGVELFASYLGVHVLLPLTIVAQERIDFTDPLHYGGLRPVGMLLRNSAVTIVVLLALYLVSETVARGTSPLDPYSQGIIIAGIAFAAMTFIGPVYLLHLHMKEKKEAKIRAITKEIGEQDPPGVVFPEIDPDIEQFEFYANEHFRLTRVENLNEFPVDFSLVVEFVLVLVLPYLAHLSSIYIFEKLLHG